MQVRFLVGVTMSYVSMAVGIAVWVLCAPELQAVQRYSQYLDAETGVIKRPEGTGWSDPFGDGVWRSSWFYASLIVLHHQRPKVYDQVVKDHGVTVAEAKTFLGKFRDNNTGDSEWTLPKNPSQKFSRDQLIPLLYLLAAIDKDSDGLRPIGKDILSKLIDLIKDKGAVSNSPQGAIHPNLRYVIDVLARKYKLNYVDGNTRALYKQAFSTSLKADSIQVQLPGTLATQDDYSVFNRLALVSLQAIVWGNSDKDVVDWRKNYRQHADKGWGPAFRIVAGRSLSSGTTDTYQVAFINRSQDNDIILGQRPHKYLSDEFPKPQFQQDASDGWLVLDYIILEGLEAVWD